MDLRERRIPNVLTYPAALAGLGLAVLDGKWGASVAGLGAGFLALLALALLVPGALGMGDVKLAGAIGAVGGFPFVLDALLDGMIIGGGLALASAMLRGRFWATVRRSLVLARDIVRGAALGTRVSLSEPEEPSATLPYGVALAAGAVVAWCTGGVT